MRLCKKILGTLLFPNGTVFLLLVPLSGVLLGYAFIAEEVHRGIGYTSYILSAAKAIGFTAAMVSMLTLETTMLTVFGEGEKGDFDRIMTGSTGVAVMLTVFVMAVYMIVKSTKELKEKNNILT